MQSLHVDVTAGRLRFLMLWLPRNSDIFGLSESCHGLVSTSIPISNPVPTTWLSPITANFIYLYIIVSTSPVTMDRPDVVLIGNSFIRRLRDNYVVPENGRKKGRDISESRPYVAQYAAQAADLGHRVTGLYTAANGINQCHITNAKQPSPWPFFNFLIQIYPFWNKNSMYWKYC